MYIYTRAYAQAHTDLHTNTILYKWSSIYFLLFFNSHTRLIHLKSVILEHQTIFEKNSSETYCFYAHYLYYHIFWWIAIWRRGKHIFGCEPWWHGQIHQTNTHTHMRKHMHAHICMYIPHISTHNHMQISTQAYIYLYMCMCSNDLWIELVSNVNTYKLVAHSIMFESF